jgi:DNA modification methylase
VGGEVCSILGTLYTGDALTVLKTLPDESVQCCVTSPPYWGLRDYGTATWEGGDAGCDHKPQPDGGPKQLTNVGGSGHPWKGTVCPKCGARRIDAQFGLEESPEAYVANMVEVFREVKRVLRRDGTLFLNVGDSYAGSGNGSHDYREAGASISKNDAKYRGQKPGLPRGLKPKDLVGIPWMLAFALRADGWWLRSDIIWAKPNPMPESVTDRPTKSHEYVFLLTKAATYYWDAEAVKETTVTKPQRRFVSSLIGGYRDVPGQGRQNGKGVPPRDESQQDYSSRNLRSVWTIATQPFKGAHFATFPQKLAETCIKAGTSERGACLKCGGPWERVVERTKPPADVYTGTVKPDSIAPVSHPELGKAGMGQKLQNWYNEHPVETLGWRPTCSCGETDTRPCLVLDPFSGAGTTGLVATKLGRDYIGIELNPAYNAMAKGRIENMLVTVNVACVGH